MVMARRRALVLAGGTLMAATAPRKPRAQTLGSVAANLHVLSAPEAAPDIAFKTQDGASHQLSEFKGRGMVVNLWATWCMPCVAEMPSLAALSKSLAPHDIAVLPLSSDRGGAERVQSWYQQHGITDLPVLLDPGSAVAHAFAVQGIPTTVIINTKNLVVARAEGGANWSSPEAQALVEHLASS
jgi:thiol-disulfide isomerase/thioredoxin